MYCNILNFLDENSIIFNRQFGFRQKHSTSHAIITLIHKITNSLDHGDIVIYIFLDLKKAFDTVDHRILLNKLYAYGIRGNVHDWFRSYLTDRSKFVIYDRERSDTKQIKCGVPQGSILGPILFIIYMNDIMNISNILYTILYADDTCAVLSGNDLPDLMKLLHTELCKLSIWLSSNKLSLNTNKTFYLLFHRARIKPVKISMKMNGSIINRVNSIKYLGVIIDHKLNWIEHIAYVKNKISKGVGILFRARHLLCRSLINLYYSFVYPYLIYCIEAWGSACQTHLHPLLLTQKKVIRVITFSPYLAHTDPIFKHLNILPLNK